MKNSVNQHTISILLADDDTDDCAFFENALSELPCKAQLSVVRDGEQLMKYLHENTDHLPDVLYLDLSMPRKTGFECLQEIKEDEKLKSIHVIMLSTSYPKDLDYEAGLIKMLNKLGASHFIRKPREYVQIKEAIRVSLQQFQEKKVTRTAS